MNIDLNRNLADKLFTGAEHGGFEFYCRRIGVGRVAFYYYFIVNYIDEAGGGFADVVVEQAKRPL